MEGKGIYFDRYQGRIQQTCGLDVTDTGKGISAAKIGKVF